MCFHRRGPLLDRGGTARYFPRGCTARCIETLYLDTRNVALPDQLKSLGSVGTLGLEMAAYLLIFTKGGQWLDGRFGTAPILERVGVGIGIFAGFYAIWKLTRSPRAEATPEPDRDGGAPGVDGTPDDPASMEP